VVAGKPGLFAVFGELTVVTVSVFQDEQSGHCPAHLTL
jgi:hypothetical protein